MRRLRLEAAVLVDEHGGHQAERAEALSDNIGLHITIVVLACPDEATFGLDSLRNHIVDEAMLVVDTSLLELFDEFILVDAFEGVLEETVILL
jgi:hypothetical protein